jgi:hypothetical protein
MIRKQANQLAVVHLFAAVLISPAAVAACSNAERTDARFVVSAGEAFDNRTGLTWRRCSAGMAWAPPPPVAARKNWSIGMRRPLSPATPVLDELTSLLDSGCGTPPVDTAIFPDVSANEQDESAYWTTSKVGMADLIYYVDFLTGQVDGHSKGFRLAVRLVRTGQ